ncbi:Outer capsid protein VP4 [Rhizoctonia solani]|uniref:Outer capsid protein VP4 n=1 Tax=Rhizoctonia solani TaxID=456999 RepID=A0A0K6FZM4_9AGAM|nr:Outer capsid protein VP4 [Rhizoctonia solani]
MRPELATPFPTAYPGPSDDDPLTDDELTLLLALPRAAESTPNATLFRFPLGPNPSMGWIDVTCAEARAIVARLAEEWKVRLSDVLGRNGQPISDISVGPGMTICILVKPDFYGIFHLLAFWALGCTVQFMLTTDPAILDDQLSQSNCKVIIYSGFDDDWVAERKKYYHGPILKLPEEEQAHRLAESEKKGQAGVSHPWPTPRRPTPALILQSSGTTGPPKLLRCPLHYYTIGLGYFCQTYLGSALSGRTFKTPHTHPRLLLASFCWQSAIMAFFVNLTTATPIAFAHVRDYLNVSSSQFVEWATALDVGAISCHGAQVHHMSRAVIKANTKFFQSLFAFTLSGTTVDSSLSEFLTQLDIRITNQFGMTELGALFGTNKPPYTYLRPVPYSGPPLMRPILGFAREGSRYVESWYSAVTSPMVALHLAHGTPHIKIEPFPEDGPHKGEPSINTGDIFQELTIKHGTETETVYIHSGRSSDQLYVGRSGARMGYVNGAIYESQLLSEINTRLLTNRAGGYPWGVGGIQLFGSNMPCTALIVQIRPHEGESKGVPQTEHPDESFIRLIHDSVEKVNNNLGLQEGQRVHTKKRTLITSSDGTFAYGPGIEKFVQPYPTLSLTHKRTTKRAENVCKFKPWLDELDFGDP